MQMMQFNYANYEIQLGMKHLSKHNIGRAGGQTPPPPKASALPFSGEITIKYHGQGCREKHLLGGPIGPINDPPP